MAIIREQVNHDTTGEEGKTSHLGRSIPHTTELIETLTETTETGRFEPHRNRERSLLLAGHGFVNLMTGCSGCYVFYK